MANDDRSPQSKVTVDELKAYLATFEGPLSLVVDVGGTNCRFGLRPVGPAVLEVKYVKVPVNSVNSFFQASVDLATRLGEETTRRIVTACVSIPGPIGLSGTRAGPIANYLGDTPEAKVVHLAALPPILFPKDRTTLLNDLEAGAYGILALHEQGQLGTYFARMWRGSETRETDAPPSLGNAHSVLLAPGTGLGTAMVHYDRLEGRHRVMPLEFGHTNVQSRTHRDILRAFRKRVARGNYEVEYDDTCSGRGLEFFYRHIKGTNETLSAAEVCRLAQTNDRDALMAMRVYYTFLMRMASQMAMGACPEQIILMGDNMVGNAFYFNQDATDAMHRTFKDHSMERLGYMSRVGVLRQIRSLNINLEGCAYVAEMQRCRQSAAKL